MYSENITPLLEFTTSITKYNILETCGVLDFEGARESMDNDIRMNCITLRVNEKDI